MKVTLLATLAAIAFYAIMARMDEMATRYTPAAAQQYQQAIQQHHAAIATALAMEDSSTSTSTSTMQPCDTDADCGCLDDCMDSAAAHDH